VTNDSPVLPWLQEHWQFFIRRLDEDRLPHALMLEGPAGGGKLELARAMTARLLCTQPHPDRHCGVCRSCRLLAGGAHPDRFNVTFEDKSDVIKVLQIRDMIASLNLTTTISGRKVVCIHPADAMNRSSANALLKSLEEPNGDATLILVSSDPGRLPATIRSRCQSIVVALPERETAAAWLAQSCDSPRRDIDLALEAAGGSALLARQYLNSSALEAYLLIRESLAKLLQRPGAVSSVCSELQEHSSEDLWRWLSLCCSEAVKSVLAGREAAWLKGAVGLRAAPLLELQKKADANRQLSSTTVRGDLLLQDWLIEWAMQVC
jgi:DNA polymerase-3 subunit delta'